MAQPPLRRPPLFAGERRLATSTPVSVVDRIEKATEAARREAQDKAQQAFGRRVLRKKTTHGVMVLCLNIGVPPPDAAVMPNAQNTQCWQDPSKYPTPEAGVEAIAVALERNYLAMQQGLVFARALDPTTASLKKAVASARKHAKNHRVLLHFNGHGVAKPTDKGELWLFNDDFTKYVPVFLSSLLGWLAGPSLLVLDCPNAGRALDHIVAIREAELAAAEDKAECPLFDVVVLAAVGSQEDLARSPLLPADLFTSCLTSPLRIALLWAASQTLVDGMAASPALLDAVPGAEANRSTLLGELRWVFAACTECIAWSCLPRDLYQRLFTLDEVVAGLLHNFVLADRITHSQGRSVRSLPALPPMHSHPLWNAWDFAVDVVFRFIQESEQETAAAAAEGRPPARVPIPSVPFFEHQLQAFETWLAIARMDASVCDADRQPMQLPALLHAIVGSRYRARALSLTATFFLLGPWAVSCGIAVGMAPYFCQLLDARTDVLSPAMLSIWARLLAVDSSYWQYLLKDGRLAMFLGSVRLAVDALAGARTPVAVPGHEAVDDATSPEAAAASSAATVNALADAVLALVTLAAVLDTAAGRQALDSGLGAIAQMLVELLELLAEGAVSEPTGALCARWALLTLGKALEGGMEGRAGASTEAVNRVFNIVSRYAGAPEQLLRAAALVPAGALLRTVVAARPRALRLTQRAAADAAPQVRVEAVTVLYGLIRQVGAPTPPCTMTFAAPQPLSAAAAAGGAELALWAWRLLARLSLDPFAHVQEAAAFALNTLDRALGLTPVAAAAHAVPTIAGALQLPAGSGGGHGLRVSGFLSLPVANSDGLRMTRRAASESSVVMESAATAAATGAGGGGSGGGGGGGTGPASESGPSLNASNSSMGFPPPPTPTGTTPVQHLLALGQMQVPRAGSENNLSLLLGDGQGHGPQISRAVSPNSKSSRPASSEYDLNIGKTAPASPRGPTTSTSTTSSPRGPMPRSLSSAPGASVAAAASAGSRPRGSRVLAMDELAFERELQLVEVALAVAEPACAESAAYRHAAASVAADPLVVRRVAAGVWAGGAGGAGDDGSGPQVPSQQTQFRAMAASASYHAHLQALGRDAQPPSPASIAAQVVNVELGAETLATLLFHPSSPHVLAASESGVVTVIEVPSADAPAVPGRSAIIARFRVPLGTHSSVAERRWAARAWDNPGDMAPVFSGAVRLTQLLTLTDASGLDLLVALSSDGVVRVYGEYASDAPLLVCAFRVSQEDSGAAPADAVAGEAALVGATGGLAAAIDSERGRLYVASLDSDRVSEWDLRSGLRLRLMRFGGGYAIRITALALSADHHAGAVLAVGCHDGSLRWLHLDDESESPMVSMIARFPSPVVALGLRAADGDAMHLLALTGDGHLRVWDLQTRAAAHDTVTADSGLSCGALAAGLGIAAVAFSTSLYQQIRILRGDGSALNTIKRYDGVMSARSGPLALLAFHPSKAWLVGASRDSAVSVWVDA